LLVGSYQNSRLSSEHIYQRITSIVIHWYSDNKEKLHLYCPLSTLYLFLCLSWETWEGEDPTADDVFHNICHKHPKGPLAVSPICRRSHSTHRLLVEGFTCMPLKKMVPTCMLLKKLFAPVCHRPKLLCSLCHFVHFCK
jgi:hypothetical protein